MVFLTYTCHVVFAEDLPAMTLPIFFCLEHPKFMKYTIEQWKKPWLFRLFRGLYYQLYGAFNKPI